MCGYVDTSQSIAVECDLKSPVDETAQLEHELPMSASTALIGCPACSNRVSETAVNFPKCGFVMTPECVQAQKYKRMQAERTIAWAQVIGVAVGLFVVIPWLNASSTSETPHTSAYSNYTPAQKVTYIDRGDFDTSATTKMQAQLSRLSGKYGISEELIAAKMLTAQELLANAHVRMTVSQIADGIEAAAPRTSVVTFDEVLATFTALRSQSSQSQAIVEMRALWSDLGLN